MKLALMVALCCAMSACATTNTKQSETEATPLPQAYIPKHPDLSLPDPVYNKVSIKDSKEVAAVLEQALSTEPQKHADLIAFVEIVGAMYINAHRNQIMDCSDKRGWKAGPGMADPDCVWPRPSADDFMGCMALQFKGEGELQKYRLSSILDSESVYIWIDRNYDTVVKDAGGESFLIRLNGLAKLGAECDKLTQDEPPEGSINV